MPFRPPDCLLVRVGELALKSEPVQRRMFGMLLDSARAALKGIDFRFEIMPNRVFVFTPEIKKAIQRLKRVFGIVSVSPAWVCHSYLDEIKVLATDIAVNVLKLGPRKSFAIRPHRVGRHPFTKRAIAEEAGAAVRRVTEARVNLSKPDIEVFIEARSRKSYIYTEKIPAAGGLPLGASGRAAAIVDNLEAAVAAWLAMKRGVELTVFAALPAKGFVAALRRWHVGRKLRLYSIEELSKMAEIVQKNKIQAVIGPAKVKKSFEKRISATGLPLLQPTAGWTAKEVLTTAAKAGLKESN